MSLSRDGAAQNTFLLNKQSNKLSLCECFCLVFNRSSRETNESFHRVTKIVVHKGEKNARSWPINSGKAGSLSSLAVWEAQSCIMLCVFVAATLSDLPYVASHM